MPRESVAAEARHGLRRRRTGAARRIGAAPVVGAVRRTIRRRPRRERCGRCCASTARRRARRITRTAPRRSSRTRKSSRCRCCCRASARSTRSRYSGRDVDRSPRRDRDRYREIRKPTVDVSLIEDNEDCISFDIEGGMRGRIWIDAETHDVLRLDRSLSGLIEIPLPRKVTRRAGVEPVLDDGAVGFVDSLQAGDVPGSARRRWCCRSSRRRCRSPAAPARRASARPRNTCRIAGSSPAPASSRRNRSVTGLTLNTRFRC